MRTVRFLAVRAESPQVLTGSGSGPSSSQRDQGSWERSRTPGPGQDLGRGAGPISCLRVRKWSGTHDGARRRSEEPAGGPQQPESEQSEKQHRTF